jgi:hypothetical protein
MKKSLTKVAHEIFGLTAQQIREGGPGDQEMPGQQPAEAQVGAEIAAIFQETYDAEGPDGLIALAYSTQPAEVQAEMKGLLESDPDGTIDIMVKALTASPDAVSAWVAFTSELAPADDAPLDESASGPDAEAPMQEEAQENGRCEYCGNECEPGESVCDSDECLAESAEEEIALDDLEIEAQEESPNHCIYCDCEIPEGDTACDSSECQEQLNKEFPEGLDGDREAQEEGNEFKPGELIEPINTHGMATGAPVMVSGIKHGQVLVGRNLAVLGSVAHVAKNYRRKAQSQNRDWGFFGSCKSNYDLTDGMVEQVWTFMVGVLLNLIPGADQAGVERFLDSTHGRHLSNELSFYGAGKGSAETVNSAIDAWSGSGKGAWVAKAYANFQKEGKLAQSDEDVVGYAMTPEPEARAQVYCEECARRGLGSSPVGLGIEVSHEDAVHFYEQSGCAECGQPLTPISKQAQSSVDGIVDFLTNSLEHVSDEADARAQLQHEFGISESQAAALVEYGFAAMKDPAADLQPKVEQILKTAKSVNVNDVKDAVAAAIDAEAEKEDRSAKVAYGRKTVGWAICCDTYYQTQPDQFKLDTQYWVEDANQAYVYGSKEEAEAAIAASPAGDEYVGQGNLEAVELYQEDEEPEFEDDTATARIAVDAKTLDYFKAYFGEFGAQLTRPIALKKRAALRARRFAQDGGDGFVYFYVNVPAGTGATIFNDDVQYNKLRDAARGVGLPGWYAFFGGILVEDRFIVRADAASGADEMKVEQALKQAGVDVATVEQISESEAAGYLG